MADASDGRITALLSRLPLFRSLEAEGLAVLAANAALRSYAAGETVFAQGTDATELYVVESGTVAVRKRADDGSEQELARFVAGELLGEVDLVDTVPRSASAVCEEPATLLVFPAGGCSFAELAERHPGVFAPLLQALLATVASRIRAANRLVSEKAPWMRELERQLYRDRLTGLANRTWLEEKLDGLLRERDGSALLVVKPDNFKAINDTWGHGAGDAVLVKLAEAGRSALAGRGELVRYRGDELVVVLDGSGLDDARTVAERLHAAVRAVDTSAATGGKALPLTASIGIAAWAGPAERGSVLTARCFGLMLEARRAGGDRSRWS